MDLDLVLGKGVAFVGQLGQYVGFDTGSFAIRSDNKFILLSLFFKCLIIKDFYFLSGWLASGGGRCYGWQLSW